MATEILPGYEQLLDRRDLRRLRRKRRICKHVGHIFYAEHYDSTTGYTYCECRRCFPHKDSILEGKLYDLMPKVDMNGDN